MDAATNVIEVFNSYFNLIIILPKVTYASAQVFRIGEYVISSEWDYVPGSVQSIDNKPPPLIYD